MRWKLLSRLQQQGEHKKSAAQVTIKWSTSWRSSSSKCPQFEHQQQKAQLNTIQITQKHEQDFKFAGPSKASTKTIHHYNISIRNWEPTPSPTVTENQMLLWVVCLLSVQQSYRSAESLINAACQINGIQSFLRERPSSPRVGTHLFFKKTNGCQVPEKVGFRGNYLPPRRRPPACKTSALSGFWQRYSRKSGQIFSPLFTSFSPQILSQQGGKIQ